VRGHINKPAVNLAIRLEDFEPPIANAPAIFVVITPLDDRPPLKQM
jgi:hypothetical protein